MEEFAAYGYWGLLLATFIAATIVPFSSEIVLTTMLAFGYDPVWCVLVATAGNWLGGLTSYGLGFLGKWEWLEKYFRLPKQKVEKVLHRWAHYGVWLALVTWLPIVGDVMAVGLGFLRCKPVPVAILMLIGKFLRFAGWTWLVVQGFLS